MTATTMTEELAARPPSPLFALTEPARAMFEVASFYAMRPFYSALPSGDGHGVLVLPGFMASDFSTAPLRRLLLDLGYDAAGWDLGRNVRVDNARVEAMSGCLDALYRRNEGRKVSIVGWSLGGVFARELAKMHPDKVRSVISMGSPISDDRGHSNAARLFEMLNGKEPEPLRNGRFTGLGKAPPVPTTSILTKSDGVVHWRGSVQKPEKDTENIEVVASHIGLGVNPAAIYAIADRLAQPEGEWKPFAPEGIPAMFFPKTIN
ncbi:alpha/beta hydrolase [Alteriqipengyuania sp. WL0013]|uniref:alpha/beta hydrolase n=1 Tax=Alteriqipengyuania sp. WL0013 TaxID=3110773 RepID=UPI002C193BBD|nr:alpha/beta hydrolase [Alteriqipengyuania sp. WL0013]MEB3415605.1 alpha/beta hydrolase [Alteriqipengyuania sp. WL0013]